VETYGNLYVIVSDTINTIVPFNKKKKKSHIFQKDQNSIVCNLHKNAVSNSDSTILYDQKTLNDGECCERKLSWVNLGTLGLKGLKKITTPQLVQFA
jgi:hypothetical protein